MVIFVWVKSINCLVKPVAMSQYPTHQTAHSSSCSRSQFCHSPCNKSIKKPNILLSHYRERQKRYTLHRAVCLYHNVTAGGRPKSSRSWGHLRSRSHSQLSSGVHTLHSMHYAQTARHRAAKFLPLSRCPRTAFLTPRGWQVGSGGGCRWWWRGPALAGDAGPHPVAGRHSVATAPAEPAPPERRWSSAPGSRAPAR